MRSFLYFLVLLSWFVASPLYAQVKGLILGPGAERYRVAVPSLKHLGQGEDGQRVARNIADVIARDLDLSGWFRIMDRSTYLEDSQRSGIKLGKFDFRDWSTIGAEALVKGGVETKGNDLVVDLRLFDVYQNKQIVGKRYTGLSKDFRRIAHRFSDEIIFQFTGDRGVFDTRIAYVSTGGGRVKEIYISHLDGTGKVQVTNNRTINLFPSWRPDGRGIVFTSYKEGKPNVFGFDLFSGRETRLSSRRGLNLGGRWSPDGKYLALSLEKRGNVDLYLLDPSGDVVRRLTKGPAIDVSPAWSPAGDRLVFVSNRSGNPHLYIVDLRKGDTRRLTYAGTYNASPDWSPKGDRIAYSGIAQGRFRIFTSEDPSWSPDGRFIAFTSNRHGRYQLYIMRADGKNQRRLTGSGGDDTNPSWSPRLKQ
jgi:TolB protein